jgi:hypothetical protein
MTPQELLNYLMNQGDSTHTASSIYLQTLNAFSHGHVKQDPGVKSKKKPDSDEEEKKEEEREEEKEKEEEEEEKEEEAEEKEVANAVYGNDISV